MAWSGVTLAGEIIVGETIREEFRETRASTLYGRARVSAPKLSCLQSQLLHDDLWQCFLAPGAVKDSVVRLSVTKKTEFGHDSTITIFLDGVESLSNGKHRLPSTKIRLLVTDAGSYNSFGENVYLSRSAVGFIEVVRPSFQTSGGLVQVLVDVSAKLDPISLLLGGVKESVGRNVRLNGVAYLPQK